MYPVTRGLPPLFPSRSALLLDPDESSSASAPGERAALLVVQARPAWAAGPVETNR